MKEKQTLTALMSSMSDGLVLSSVNGTILYANPGAQMIIGPFMEVWEGAQIASLHTALRQASGQPEEYDSVLACIEQGETPTWVIEMGTGAHKRFIRLQLFDVHDESGRVSGRGLLLRDVTHEHEIDQLKTTLLATVGHELRTPLSVIKGNASTLLQKDVTWAPEDQEQMLQSISAQADRLAQLVRDLLDLSRLEAGILLLNRRPRQLVELLNQALRQLDEAIPALAITLPEQLPLLDLDGPRIEVVLRNLLVNARAYGAGEVRITVRQEADQVVVAVWNDGPGIAPEELPHIFERFYRAKQGIQERSGGTGLGLAICKAFIEAHGGSIWAESSEDGTTIAFSLPIASVYEAAPPEGHQQPSMASSTPSGC